ncbi:MAG TPA: DUF2975 domain-containing protein [Phnomibacter sp.]|nr:DUF2975 domain-containing protein [Phnomibacter sp.]
MSTKTNFVWRFIQVVCWVIFIGLCIQTGALLFNFIYSLYKPVATHRLYMQLNLHDLYQQNFAVYSGIMILIIGISAYKAYVFYRVIKLFEILNLVKPFSQQVQTAITQISYHGFGIGLISFVAHKVVTTKLQPSFSIGIAPSFWNDWGAYLMMSAILYVIALIFKKGIALQSEVDLTV